MTLRALGLLLLGWMLAPPGHTRNVLDELGQRLTFASTEHERWLRLSSQADLTLYHADEPPSGMLFADDYPFLAPRLAVNADAGLGSRVLAHVRVTADRGFDPGVAPDGDVRADEYFLQADVLDAARGRLRVGKFATAFGAWVNRHLPWDNPLISAPALYEDIVTITDAAAPADQAAFLARRNQPENKPAWVPIVWGPSNATGVRLSMGAGAFDVDLEAKNAPPASRPVAWNDRGDAVGTTLTGRLTWRPRPEWQIGASFSEGPYLREAARATLPAGADLDDFDQRLVGLDLGYEHHRLQVWAELAANRFDVPGVGAADMVGGFVEIRAKLAPRWWLAGRWNQSWFEQIDAAGEDWDRDLKRADLALGFRHSAHVEAKLEYNVGDQQGGNVNGNWVVAGQLVVWF